MGRGLLAAIVLLLVAAADGRADGTERADWYERAKAFFQKLSGQPVADPDIIVAPADIDRQMVLAPPQSRTTMRVIPPPE